jgi:hypothetical protein
MKKMLFFLIGICLMGIGFHNSFVTAASEEECAKKCQNENEKDKKTCIACCKGGVKLNTNIPFVGKCIVFDKELAASEAVEVVDQISAFPKLMGALMNIIMTASLIIGFVLIVVGGIMMTTGGISSKNFSEGKGLIMKV